MEYLVKHCPKCNGELHVPIDMENCICMFCGERFDVQSTVSVEAEVNSNSLEKDYQSALGTLLYCWRIQINILRTLQS